jgi:hypothetical protein
MKLSGKTQAQLDVENNIISLNQEKNLLQKYLDDTDWYVIRFMERQIAIPEEVASTRLTNINRINEIKVLLNE